MTFSNLIHVMLISFLLAAISGCAGITPPQKQTIDAVFDIAVTDPVYRRLTEATTKAKISASGKFKPGNYTIKGTTVRIKPDTSFTLELTVPLDDPKIISTRQANGKFWTSTPLVIKEIAAPQSIVLHKGKVTGEIDLGQILGAFLLNVLVDQVTIQEESTDLRNMIASMHVELAEFDLKPGSFLKFGKKIIHVGNDSKIELTNVNIDDQLNYSGKCLLQIQFLKDSKWIGERSDFNFNGGNTTMLLNIKRTKKELSLSLQDKNQKITMDDSLIRWGKNKRSSAHSTKCDIVLQNLLWKKTRGSGDPSLSMSAAMLMADTHLNLITDTQETDAMFVGLVPATIKIDIDEKGRATEFMTHQVETAKTAKITISRPASTVIIYLDEAQVGPFSVDKFGQTDFKLSEGAAKLRQLEWKSAKHSFSVTTSGQSELSLPDGMELSSTGKPGGAHMSLPISLELGKAVLKGDTEQLKLSNINGTLTVNVDRDVRISSDMDFSIDNSSLIGGQRADVTARGFDLSAADGHAVAEIKNCTIDWSQDAWRNAIVERLPKNKTFTVNKIIEDQKWRYRNATLNTVTMKNLNITDMSTESTNLINFTADADILAEGTIDKGGLMTAITHESEHWETRPWSASGRVTGTGSVKYKLVPGTSLANSSIAYDLNLQLPTPDDIDINWDAVSSGLMRSAEKAVIASHMKKVEVPINYKGRLTIGNVTDTNWKDVKINKLVCSPSGKGSKLTFSATAVF